MNRFVKLFVLKYMHDVCMFPALGCVSCAFTIVTVWDHKVVKELRARLYFVAFCLLALFHPICKYVSMQYSGCLRLCTGVMFDVMSRDIASIQWDTTQVKRLDNVCSPIDTHLDAPYKSSNQWHLLPQFPQTSPPSKVSLPCGRKKHFFGTVSLADRMPEGHGENKQLAVPRIHFGKL